MLENVRRRGVLGPFVNDLPSRMVLTGADVELSRWTSGPTNMVNRAGRGTKRSACVRTLGGFFVGMVKHSSTFES